VRAPKTASISYSKSWNHTFTNDVEDVKINDNYVLVQTSNPYKVFVFNKSTGTKIYNITLYQEVLSIEISETENFIITTNQSVCLFNITSKVPLWNVSLTQF
jgi:hypothetical protein